jgi:tetrahydromethanopterin S-methyltransferase subunit B
MKNQSINSIIGTNGVSAGWFTRQFTLALAGIVTSILFGALINPEYRGLIATLVHLR